jgi:hypothetical protein
MSSTEHQAGRYDEVDRPAGADRDADLDMLPPPPPAAPASPHDVGVVDEPAPPEARSTDEIDREAEPERGGSIDTATDVETDADVVTDAPAETEADTHVGTDTDTEADADVVSSVPPAGVADDVVLIDDPDQVRQRWQSVQVGFVDDPRAAIDDAGKLVDEVVERVVTGVAAQRDRLGESWSTDEPDTEQLRLALRRYREFLDRLLAI